MTDPIIEAAARALHRCEAVRSAISSEMISKANGKPLIDHMEAWEDVAEIFRADADAALEAACDAIGWPQIRAFQEELRKGQDIYEDAGGFFSRAIRALLGRSRVDPVTNYQDAARALIHHVVLGEPRS